ncbi:MAG: AAA family ATPase [Spirochaetia bacterium]|nr:AAA family ATPase [Spirochaetia bacterium]
MLKLISTKDLAKRATEILKKSQPSSWVTIDTSSSSLIWGARRTGKSFWINENYQNEDIILIALLETDTLAEYLTKPSLLRERFQDTTKLIVIDEIQKSPVLHDEIHWLIEKTNTIFLLTGSSTGKLVPSE